MKLCETCDAADKETVATTLIKSVHDAVPLVLCTEHAQQRKAELSNVLTPFTETSIIEKMPTTQALLSETSQQLQESDRLNRGLTLQVKRLETEKNEIDQERQSLRVQLAKMQERAELSELALTRYTGLSLEQSLERLEVEDLASVNAGSDPNGPSSVIQGG